MLIRQQRCSIYFFLFLLCFSVPGYTQQKEDTTLIDRVNSNKTFKKLSKLITRQPESNKPFHVKSEDGYLNYEGKIIRKIIIKRVGFESTITDTTQVVRNFFSNAANTLHTNTRESVIRNNLFIRENTPLNPYRVADNERTLRNLDFVMDARIYVKVIPKKADSVDLLVVTRDVFSMGGSVSARLPSVYKINIKEINVNGMGEFLEFGQVLDTERSPQYGYEALYSIKNIKGTFLDAKVAYSKLKSWN